MRRSLPHPSPPLNKRMRALFGFPTGRETRPVDSEAAFLFSWGRGYASPTGDIKKRQDSAPSRGGDKRESLDLCVMSFTSIRFRSGRASPLPIDNPDSVRAETTTLALRLANWSAVSRPMPLEAPTTATTCCSIGLSFIWS